MPVERDKSRNILEKSINQIKVALVTGGAKRLGREIAIALAQEGYSVAINYLKSDAEAVRTAEAIHERGVKCRIYRADVSIHDQVKDMVDRIEREIGPVEVLVNNAAIFEKVKFFHIEEKNWDKTLNTNLKGTFLCSKVVGEHMIKRGRGIIINMVSVGGFKVWKNYLPYNVSKSGVLALTKGLAKILAPHVNVFGIAPGVIDFNSDRGDGSRHIPVERIPLGRYGKPADITGLVLFLVRNAGYITGETFIVDGGLIL